MKCFANRNLLANSRTQEFRVYDVVSCKSESKGTGCLALNGEETKAVVWNLVN